MSTDGDDAARPRLEVRFASDGASLLMDRHQISESDWVEIAATVAETLPRLGYPLSLSSEQLFRKATHLRGILKRIGAIFAPDEGVRTLLQVLAEDRQAISAALATPGGVEVEARELARGPFAVSRPLMWFQEQDLERLWRLRHGANFSVPGAGKTTVTYALHAREQAVGRVDRLLVVGPLSAFSAWEDEAGEVLHPKPTVVRLRGEIEGDPDVLLVNYQRLAGSASALAAWMSDHSVHLVIDEAHRAKRGSLGEWGRVLLTLAPLAARRDLLTGTPAPNHPRDLVSLLDILWPGGTASRALPRDALVQDPTVQAMTGVNAAIRPLYVRTTKEHLQLPDVTFHPVPVDMGPLQRDIYDALLSRYAGMLDLGQSDAAMLAQMGEVAMYLIQAASSPQLLATSADPSRAYRYPPLAIPPGSHLAHMIDRYADHEIPAKIAAACRIIHQNANADPPLKTLVWSNFPDNLLALERQLASLQPALVYGGVSSAEDAEPGVRTRERELTRFQEDGDCRVLLANPAAMAEGVSLHHRCHHAIYIDRTFNAGQYMQSIDRIHRLGLQPGTETHIWLLTASGTIDERVGRRVDVKMRRLSQMLADPALVRLSLPDDEDSGPLLDDELDLREVLSHLAEGSSSQ